jgi:prolyl oligopeptidase
MLRISKCCLFLALVTLMTTNVFMQTRFNYPKAKKVDQVDDYHGVRVPDPFRALEDPDAPDSRTWIDAQNAVTNAYLNQIPQRAAIRERLTKLWNYERYSTPFKVGNNYFYSRNDGLQNQSVMYIAKSPTDKGRVFLDPNKLSTDGTVALAGTRFSDDGKLVAIGTSAAGSDMTEWRIMEVETGRYLEDKLEKATPGDILVDQGRKGFLLFCVSKTECEYCAS